MHAERFLDRFVVVRQLARGSLGPVYLVRDVDAPARGDLALRVLETASTAPSVLRERLATLRAIAAVPSASLARIVALAPDPASGDLVLVREQGELGTLDAVIARRPDAALELDELLSFARAMLTGIDDLHRAGLAHGRVQASNVIAGRGAQRARLADAGLAAFHGHEATNVGDVLAASSVLARAAGRGAPRPVRDVLRAGQTGTVGAADLLIELEAAIDAEVGSLGDTRPDRPSQRLPRVDLWARETIEGARPARRLGALPRAVTEVGADRRARTAIVVAHPIGPATRLDVAGWIGAVADRRPLRSLEAGDGAWVMLCSAEREHASAFAARVGVGLRLRCPDARVETYVVPELSLRAPDATLAREVAAIRATGEFARRAS